MFGDPENLEFEWILEWIFDWILRPRWGFSWCLKRVSTRILDLGQQTWSRKDEDLDWENRTELLQGLVFTAEVAYFRNTNDGYISYFTSQIEDRACKIFGRRFSELKLAFQRNSNWCRIIFLIGGAFNNTLHLMVDVILQIGIFVRPREGTTGDPTRHRNTEVTEAATGSSRSHAVLQDSLFAHNLEQYLLDI